MTPSPSPPTRKAKDAPAFDFYPERWTHGTRHLSKVERCDFLDLLAVQWTEDGIVDDLPRIARMLGYRSVKQISQAVLEKFPVAEDGRRRHPFLEKLRAEQRERIRVTSERQRERALKRWGQEDATNMPRHESGNATAMPRQCPPPTTHHPPRKNILSSGGSNHAQARETAPFGVHALACQERHPPSHTPRPADKDVGAPSHDADKSVRAPFQASPSAHSTSSEPAASARERSQPRTLNPEPGTVHFPTLPDVQNHGITLGADPACCEAFWQECEAVHWVNKHGIPIADWRPLLARFRTRWVAVESQRAAHAHAPSAHPPQPSSLPKSPHHASGKPHPSHANTSQRPARIAGELNRPGRYA